jgi:ABC-2 type transport system permease protein
VSGVAPALRACVHKELLLLGRDLHGLALLFIMPLAFVLIMSLALQTQFAERAGTRLKVLVVDASGSAPARELLATLGAGGAFTLVRATDAPDGVEQDRQLRRGDYAFALDIAPGFGTNGAFRLDVRVAPDSSAQTEALFTTGVRAALGRARLRALLQELGAEAALPANDAQDDVAVHYSYAAAGGPALRPTSVQQSVPAWLVFGAFFVVVPLSNTFIRERQQGTLRRLRSAGLGTTALFGGKLIPYFLVNQLQVVLMLLAGRFLVPLLGGEALRLDTHWWLLGVMSTALSFTTLGLALLVAVSSETTEQATLLSGTGNIVLAALGGIMVPKFVMPAAMQHIASWSPMSWGLEGFLDLLLRQGGLRAIAPEALGLTALGVTSILAAALLHARRRD